MRPIHSWQDIEDMGGMDALTPAERALIDTCKAGEPCKLCDGTLPPEGPADPEREVRAPLLRYLILGGCESCPVRGWGLNLIGGHVTGSLDLSFASAQGITGLVSCRFDDPIVALQSHFKLLNLDGSALPGLNAQGAEINGDVFLNDVTATGAVSLSGATIGGQLACTGARFQDEYGHALNAQNAQVTGAVFLRDVTATGTVRLSSATIGGQLSCTGATFQNENGHALNAQGAQVTGAVVLRDFTATGAVSLSGATIGGQLHCTGARFKNDNGDALNAEGAQITGDVFLDNVTATGAVSLSGASIGGQLSCTGARFQNENGHALNAQGALVTEGVFLREVTATGAVSLSGASIGGQLDCTGARFKNENGDAVNAQRLRITEGLFWRDVTVPEGTLDFASAHAGDLVDDPGSWPGDGRLYLDGFTYDRISGAFTDAGRRKNWLEKGAYWNGEFFPQPFTQLSKVLREMGHDADARAVLFRREQLMLRHSRARAKVVADGDVRTGLRSVWRDARNAVRWLWDWILRLVMGYGHYPFRSVIALALLICLATLPASRAWEEGSFAPNSGPVLVSQDWKDFADIRCDRDHPGYGTTYCNPAARWSAETEPGQDWETFNRYAWAADLVIPIIDIGQTDAWAPSTTRGWWGWHLWWARWLFIAAGWLVTALGAAAITGLIRRD